MGGASKGRPQCILGFVVHLHLCSQRAGPRDPENYNPQQPGRKREKGGSRHVDAQPGRAISQCSGGSWGTGAFCLEQLQGVGPRSGETGGLPQLARSWPPLSGVGGPPPGPASPQAPPSRPRPARPPAPPGQLKGKNWLGLLAGPSHLRSRCHHHHHPPRTEPQAAPRPSGRRHEDQGCQETL